VIAGAGARCERELGRTTNESEPSARGEPRLGRLVAPLLEVRRSLVEQIQTYDRCLIAIARRHAVVRRLMGVPGVGAVTAVAFVAAIDDPSHFRRSRHVAAYFGLAPRRDQSGEVDRPGRISKAGDQLVRTLLYEAANALLTRSRQPSALKTWAETIAARCRHKKAKVALARKLAVVSIGFGETARPLFLPDTTRPDPALRRDFWPGRWRE
jgi:transposase